MRDNSEKGITVYIKVWATYQIKSFKNHLLTGEMAEWLNAAVLKTVEEGTLPRVRIPVSPSVIERL